MRTIPIIVAALLLGTAGASAASAPAHAGFDPGAAIDAATLGSVPLGDLGHGGATLDDIAVHRAATAGPVGGFNDRD